jgi:hypothetical protein
MRYLLDTDSVTDFYEPDSSGHPSIAGRIAALRDEDLVFLSILSVAQTDFEILPLGSSEASRPGYGGSGN